MARKLADRVVLLAIATSFFAFWWLVALAVTSDGEAIAESVLDRPIHDPADEFHELSWLLILVAPPIATWLSLVRLNDALARREGHQVVDHWGDKRRSTE